MGRIKQSRSIREFGQPLLETRRVANPYLPLVADRCYTDTTWVYVGRLNTQSTETAGTKFDFCHCELLSAVSRAAITAPRSASRTTGARCKDFV